MAQADCGDACQVIGGGNYMVFLTDRLNEEAGNLIYSLARSGYDVQTVVSGYDGYLPDGVLSPYGFYVNGKKEPEYGLPRYFNQIDLPDFWEIESTTTSGEVHEYEDLRAKLFYADPKSERHLKIIDWLDKKGKVRCSDHYDRYGRRFAQTILDRNQKTVHKSYYDADGREVVTENLNTGDIILTDEGRNYFFRSKADFIAHFLQDSGLNTDRLMFNSLSTPFFAAEKLQQTHPGRNNVLFWQEPIRDDIPGNMRTILDRSAAGVSVIAVQRQDAYKKIRELAVDQNRFKRLGYIYPVLRENTGSRNALVFTNSDQVEKLAELIKSLPDVHFHIGALTEMSPKLLVMEIMKNVNLYPAIWEETVNELWSKCDIYLDINHGGEILAAVRTAFMNNQLIFAFSNTAHNRFFTDDRNIFEPDSCQKMAEQIRNILADKNRLKDALRAQRSHAHEATERNYQEVLG